LIDFGIPAIGLIRRRGQGVRSGDRAVLQAQSAGFGRNRRRAWPLAIRRACSGGSCASQARQERMFAS